MSPSSYLCNGGRTRTITFTLSFDRILLSFIFIIVLFKFKFIKQKFANQKFIRGNNIGIKQKYNLDLTNLTCIEVIFQKDFF